MRKKNNFLMRVMALTLVGAMSLGGNSITASAADAAEQLEENLQGSEEGYTYVYAGLTWQEFWESEGVYLSGDDWTASSTDLDAKGETDKGAFDAVSRATTNHGLHRGSFQCTTVIHASTADGVNKDFSVSSWEDNGATLVLTDGTKVSFAKGTITEADGTIYTMSGYEVLGNKYIPVAVKNSDYEAFKEQYTVVENGTEVTGGFTENNLHALSETAEVTADTNGLKMATKNEDGSFSFSQRTTGSGSGLKDEAQKTASDIVVTVKEANGSYGEFLRVDLTGDGYGDLGSKLYAVRWTYYGDDSSYSTELASYGTKFAADNWMHKAMGIQLGLTNSLRCQLPNGYDGTGYWTLTVYAMGYADYTVSFEATAENIVGAKEDEQIDTAELEKLIIEAKALNEEDYTTTSWANMQTELSEAIEEAAAKHSQATVDEAYTHLKQAIDALEKKQVSTEEPSDTDTPKDDTSNKDTSNNDTSNKDTSSNDTSKKTTTTTYKITYKTNGGTLSSKAVKSYNTKKAVTLVTPTKKGYTFAGWYADSKFKTKVTSIKKGSTGNKTLYAKWTKVSVAKATLSKATNVKGKKLTATWKKVSGAKGYQISYSTNKKFTKSTTVTKNTSKTSYTAAKLKKGKTYYVRVRAYKIDSTKAKVYGKWSSVNKVKITK